MSDFAALRKKWANMANRVPPKNKQPIFLARALNAADPENMPPPLPFDVPDPTILNAGMEIINAQRNIAMAKFRPTPSGLTNLQRRAPKPKYNMRYLSAKKSRGNNVTKHNRSKVRIQQLQNYVKNSSNPIAIKSAQNQINQLRRNGGGRKTRRRY
jgi:hypothetical protein